MTSESSFSSSNPGDSSPESADRSQRDSRQGSSYVNNVDELIQNTPLSLVLMHYGLQPPQNSIGEYRMKCVFNETCSDSQYGNLTVRQDVAKQIYCHSCETRGNLLTLIHGLETHQPPSGGRLRGQEFKAAVQKLRQINGEATTAQPQRTYKTPAEMKQQRREYESKSLTDSSQSSGRSPDRADSGSGRSPDRASNSPTRTSPESKPPVKFVNTPLIRHDKEAARDIADLYKDLIVDVAQMSPEAAQYVRKRPWMTPELMQKWGVGWIPGNGRSLFRKGYLVYTHRNERGEIISYSGRDLNFETKWDDWIKSGKPEGKKPGKHRYVSGFHRGLELYGGHATRLQEPWVKESLNRYGIVIVEGMNDVMRLDELKVAAVGLGSNKVTAEQLDKLTRFARQLTNNRILLMPDCDEEGEAGFKDLLWKLCEAQVQVRLGWSSRTHASRQPESITYEEWMPLKKM